MSLPKEYSQRVRDRLKKYWRYKQPMVNKISNYAEKNDPHIPWGIPANLDIQIARIALEVMDVNDL